MASRRAPDHSRWSRPPNGTRRTAPVGAFLPVPLLIFGLVIFNHLVVGEEPELPT